MSDIKGGQSQKAKSTKTIIIVSLLAASFFIAFFAATTAVASSSDSQECNNNLVFSLAVNGTLQTTQRVNLNLGPQTSSSTYCEIYTLTNEGNTPITITATSTLSPSGAATLNWQGGLTVTLSTGMSQKMILTLTDFSEAGAASVTFSSERAPCVTISPSSVTLCVGQSQSFESSVTGGTSPFKYQWCVNGAAVSGATKSTWTFTPTSAGSYAVCLNVTDNIGAQATSNVATVIVKNRLSVCISPSSVEMQVGKSQLFTSSVAGGSPSYTYQWYLNGAPVSGATNPNWTFTPKTSGSYTIYLEVTDSTNTQATSSAAIVIVQPK